MITRIWHGWTSPADADKYEAIVRAEVFEKLEKEPIPGYRGMQLLRKKMENEVEFISMMWFDKIEDVAGFVGQDYEVAHVPDVCRKVLLRFEEKVAHYEVRQQLSYDG